MPDPTPNMKRIIRDRHLTPAEAATDNAVRKQVERELPDLIARHHARSGALGGPATIAHMPAPLPERKPTRQELADKWTGKDCTLDGRPARVLGRLNECATVAGTEQTAAFAFFAWPIVDTVMRNGGHFNTQ